MKENIKLQKVNDFIKILNDKKFSNKKKLTIINNYVKFIESFEYSYIWPIDDNGNFLYNKNGLFGYYEFDGSSKGNFVQVSEEIYQKAKNKIMLYGDIKIEHQGKMYISSTRFWIRLTISNVYGMDPNKAEELIRYDLYLTENCLKEIGF